MHFIINDCCRKRTYVKWPIRPLMKRNVFWEGLSVGNGINFDDKIESVLG